jgi:four helix bundle protein
VNEESQNASYREFIQRVKIALREANETKYWLRIIKKLEISNTNIIEELCDEASQITLILGAIASKAEKKTKDIK